MNNPSIRKAGELKNWTESANVDGCWIPARPIPFQGFCLFWRIKLAWRVFTGRYDALDWEANQ